MTSTEHAEQIVQIIREHANILVIAHSNPDGDAVGSTIGTGWILNAMGKHFALFNRDDLPEYLQWVAMPSPWLTSLKQIPFKPDLMIILDCGDFWRIGKELGGELGKIPSVNIDHHSSNPAFGTLHNWVDAGMAATGMMLEYISDVAGVPLTDHLAESMYLSIVSDTGSFTHGNTSAEVFRLAERLLRSGFNAAAWRNKYDNQWTMTKTLFWGVLFGKVRLALDGIVALCSVTLQDLRDANASQEDMEGFVEQMRKIKGVRVAVLLKELPDGGIKCSLRSCEDDDVNVIAQSLGGGGHKNAAGFILPIQPMEKAEQGICEAIKRQLAPI